jgi:copper transport protein
MWWIMAPQIAFAHAELVSTTPENGAHLDAAPDEIVLTFSEPVGIVEGGTSLHAGDVEPQVLTPRAEGATIIVPLGEKLDDGAFTVQWRVISADSHPISGTVSFTVGDTTEAVGSINEDRLPGWVDALRTIATAVKYIGLLTAVGAVVVGRIIAAPDRRQVLRTAGIAAVIALVGVIVELPLIGMELRGYVDRDVSGAVWALDDATLWTALVCVALLVASVVAVRVDRRSSWLVTGCLLSAALLIQLASGHTRTKDPTWLMMSADAVHLLSGAIWLGGIVLLVAGLTGRWRGDAFGTADRSAIAVSRFSAVAAYIAALVVVSGGAMAIIILRSWNALVDTHYGITLLLKIGFVALITVLAAVNRFVLIPRIRQTPSGTMLLLKRLVIGELVLLLAIGGITARLVAQDPNVHATNDQPAEMVIFEGESALDDGHSVQVTVIDQGNRQYEVRVNVLDAEGFHVVLDSGLEVSWTQPEQQLGPIQQSLMHNHVAGIYYGTVTLPVSGTWEATIRADIDRFTDSRVSITVELPD